MHVEFLVEEPSAEAALEEFLPRLFGDSVSFQIHAHQGKQDLLNSLECKLRAYARWIPEYYRIVVLVDRDDDDCVRLKRRLESIATNARLRTKTESRHKEAYVLLNRIAIEELEAWFFGDVRAICAAFPRVPHTLGAKAAYRDPDKIRGGTWEALERVLRRVGYFKGGIPKIAVARAIAARMDLGGNQSRSFQIFRDGLIALANVGGMLS